MPSRVRKALLAELLAFKPELRVDANKLGASKHRMEVGRTKAPNDELLMRRIGRANGDWDAEESGTYRLGWLTGLHGSRPIPTIHAGFRLLLRGAVWQRVYQFV